MSGVFPHADSPTSKEMVLHLVQQMPAEASLDEISEQVAILAALQRSERAADAGKLVAHDEVKRRLSSWLTK